MTARLLLHALLFSLLPGLVSSCAQSGDSAQVRDAGSSSNVAGGPAAVEEFQKRVKAYAQLERKLESQLPKLQGKAEPERIIAHKQTLAKSIQQARTDAKPGDLFIPAVHPIIKQIVRSETAGPQGAQARGEISETAAKKASNDAPAAVNLKVNSPYPGDASLSTVPPDLLLKLPELPDEVDYRFVNRYLILRSVKANLILDVLPGVLPPPARRKQ